MNHNQMENGVIRENPFLLSKRSTEPAEEIDEYENAKQYG